MSAALARAVARRRRCGSCTSGSATSSAPTRPGTPAARDADDWGIAAFTGRSAAVARRPHRPGRALHAGHARRRRRPLRGRRQPLPRARGRRPRRLAGVLRLAGGGRRDDHGDRGRLLRGAGGGLDAERPEVRADLEALRQDPTALVRTDAGTAARGDRRAPARRRRAACRRAVRQPAGQRPDRRGGSCATRPSASAPDARSTGSTRSVSFVTTMVDRITPRTTPEDVRAVRDGTGARRSRPGRHRAVQRVGAERRVPAGRPPWEDAGATFTDDVTPFEHRKLWLLNGAHSLLGLRRLDPRSQTVAEAVADDACRGWVEQWWAEASSHLDQPPGRTRGVPRPRCSSASRTRACSHRLDQIAADGSQKLPIRILPVLRAERAAGRMPEGAARALAAWVCHLRGLGAPVDDAHADAVVPLAQGPLARRGAARARAPRSRARR